MEIRTRERDGVVIVEPEGRLVVGNVEDVRSLIAGLITEGKTNIVINLAKVEYIDSTGLGGLVICYTSAKKAGGGARLLNLNKRNVELLVLTKLHTIFEVFDNEDDAVNSFFPERKVNRFDILSFVQQNQKDE
jgi:anti-sigma B factor antagonist